jgi:hypothetical protein
VLVARGCRKVLFLLLFCGFLGTGVSSQGFVLTKQALYHLSYTSFCRWVSQKLFARLASNCDPPDLYLPRS